MLSNAYWIGVVWYFVPAKKNNISLNNIFGIPTEEKYTSGLQDQKLRSVS